MSYWRLTNGQPRQAPLVGDRRQGEGGRQSSGWRGAGGLLGVRRPPTERQANSDENSTPPPFYLLILCLCVIDYLLLFI